MPKKSKLLPLAALTVLSLSFFGCEKYVGDKVKSCYTALPETGWVYGDAVGFEIGMPSILADTARLEYSSDGVDVHYNPSDSIISGDMVVSIRHTDEYPYANLWLEVEYTHPRRLKVNDTLVLSADTIMRDTVNLRLADSYGIWLGTGMGSSCQLQDTILKNVQVRRTEPVRVRHIMRVDTLTGLQQIGMQII